MSKTLEYNFNNFSGGISDDPREQNPTKFQSAQHFDVFSQPNRLIPYRSLESDVDDGTAVSNSGSTSPNTSSSDPEIGSLAWADTNNSLSSNNTYTTTTDLGNIVVVDSYAEGNQSSLFALRAGGFTTRVAQSFTNTSASNLESSKFFLKKVGSPTGNIYAKLYSHTGTFGTSGRPDTLLATSEALDISTLTTSYALSEFIFLGSEKYAMSASTKYSISIEYNTGTADSDNYLAVGSDNTSESHTGSASIYVGTWATTVGDLIFYVYEGLSFTENSVKLVRGSSVQGNNKSTGAILPATDTYVTYGGETDTWGLSLSRSDVNDPNFGIVFSVKGVSISHYLKVTNFGFSVPVGSAITGVKVDVEQKASVTVASIDHVRITVYYAENLQRYFAQDFLYASASSKLYALGQTGTGNTKILQKADATTGLWTKPASSEGNGSVRNGCLVEYKDYLWGFQGNTQVFKWGLLSGTPTITNSAGTVDAITSVAQGLIAKDDNLYLPYNNKIARVNPGGTVQNDVLILPSNFKITSIANYGNYLAIGCAPVSTFNGTSKVYLWNLTSDDVQEAIDWGEGELRVLEVIEGMIVGVTDQYLNNATGAGKGTLIIQVYQGGTPQVIKQVFTEALTGKSMPLSKSVKNNRLFFAAKIMTNAAGTEYNEGIWSFGRKNVNYPFALNLDVIDENINTSGIQGFGTAANYFFIAHSADGSVDKTNDASTYAFTSIYESQIIDFEDVFSDKTLLTVDVSFARLLSGQALTALYRLNGTTSWVTIGTFDTVGAVSKTFLNIEATGLPLGSGREMEFRLESTGGLEITGLSCKARINNNA